MTATRQESQPAAESSPRGTSTPTRRLARGWPAGPITVIVPVMAIIAAVLVQCGPYDAEYREWVTTSAALHESLAMAGPVIALWAAVLGHALAGRRRYFGSLPAARRSEQLRAHLMVIWVLALLAVLLGWLPSALQAMDSATWGRPSLLDLAILVAGIVAITTVAMVAGSFISRPRWIAVVPILTLVYLQLPSLVDRAFSVISPVQAWTSSVRFGPNPSTALYCCAVALLMAAVAACAFHTSGPSVGRLILALVPLGAMLIVPFVWRPDLYILRSDPSPVCSSAEGTQVCVHPGHRRSLASITEVVNRLNRAVGGPSLTLVLDTAAADDLRSIPGRVLVAAGPDQPDDEVAAAIFTDALGLSACAARYEVIDSDRVPAAWDISAAMTRRALRVADHAGVTEDYAITVSNPAIAAAVDGLSPARFARTVSSNLTRIRSCSMTVEDL